MSTKQRLVGFWLLAAWLATGLSFAHAAEICNRVVAVVNDDMISLHELNARIQEFTGMPPAEMETRDREQFLAARREVLSYMIDERLAKAKIRELGIEVSQKEVDDAIEQVKRENGVTQDGLLAQLEQQNLTWDTYRQRIRDDLERIRLINREVNSKIIVRDEEVKAYYDAHPEEFQQRDKIHLAVIFLQANGPAGSDAWQDTVRRGEELMARLKAGEDFGQLARTYSQGPGAQEGGDLGTIEIAQLDTQMRQTCAQMAVGDIAGPILRPPLVQIVQLLDRPAGGPRSFEAAREQIHQLLYMEEVNRRYEIWIKDLREKAYTRIIF